MASFNEIAKANEQIRTTDIKGKDYAEVNQRVKAFRMVCPDGGIVTEILSLTDGVVTMKATVIDADGKVLGTGHAQEKESSSYINKTSFIENCETSAVGRALGMCGYGIDTSICSADELNNALANQGQQTQEKIPQTQQQKPVMLNQSDDDPLGLMMCSECGVNINEAVYNFSQKVFHRPLCRECQQKVKAGT